MKLFNIPIIGKINQSCLTALYKVENNTPESIWKGIKGIYSTDEKSHICGTYIESDKEGKSSLNFILTYKDKSIEKISLCEQTLPIIIISSGNFKDEYNFAFNLLHEVGHHNGCNQEWKAHKFASQYVNINSGIYCKKEHHTFVGGKEGSKKFFKKLKRQHIMHGLSIY